MINRTAPEIEVEIMSSSESSQALALQRSGNFVSAFEIYAHYLAKSKNSSYPAAHGAGYCKRALRDFEAASYYFQEAARIAPDRFEPLLEIANIQYRLREYKKALISIDAALAHTKETEKIKLLRIRMLNGLGEYGQRRSEFAMMSRPAS